MLSLTSAMYQLTGPQSLQSLFSRIKTTQQNVPITALYPPPEKLINWVQMLYENTSSHVRCATGISDSFPVKVGVHEGSAVSLTSLHPGHGHHHSRPGTGCPMGPAICWRHYAGCHHPRRTGTPNPGIEWPPQQIWPPPQHQENGIFGNQSFWWIYPGQWQSPDKEKQL